MNKFKEPVALGTNPFKMVPEIAERACQETAKLVNRIQNNRKGSAMDPKSPKAVLNNIAEMIQSDPLAKDLLYPLRPTMYELFATFALEGSDRVLAEIDVDFDCENDHALRLTRGKIRVRTRWQSGSETPANCEVSLKKLSEINALASAIEARYKDVEMEDWWDE